MAQEYKVVKAKQNLGREINATFPESSRSHAERAELEKKETNIDQIKRKLTESSSRGGLVDLSTHDIGTLFDMAGELRKTYDELNKQNYEERLKALPKFFQDNVRLYCNRFGIEECLNVAEGAVTIIKKLKTRDEINKIKRAGSFLSSIGVKGEFPRFSVTEALDYLEYLEKNNIDVNSEIVLEDNNDEPLYHEVKLVIPGTKKEISMKDGYGNKFIGELIISDGVEKIGSFAFVENLLTKVDIPASVREIDMEGFAHNPLREVIFHYGLKIIGDNAFLGTEISKANIPGSVEEIEYNAFTDTPLEELVLNNGLKKIGNGAFQRTKIKNLDIPGSVVEIGIGAFEDTPLETVAFCGEIVLDNDSIRKIDDTSQKIIIENDKNLGNVDKIGSLVFADAPKEELFSLNGKNSNEIYKRWCNLPAQKKLDLIYGKDVISIGHRAFQNTKLKKVDIPGYISAIYDEAFANTPLEEIVFNEGVKYIGSHVIKNTKVKEVIVPESILAIDVNAFEGSSIEKLYLPKKFENNATIIPMCYKELHLPGCCEVIYY